MIEPKGNMIQVRPDEVPDTFNGTIVKVAKEKPKTGRIVAISKDLLDHPYSVNQRIHFNPNQQHEVGDGTVLINGCPDLGAVSFIYND